MHIPASEIAIAEPLCPSCAAQTAEGDRACASCGFSFEFARQLLPYSAPELRKFIDHDGVLHREDFDRGTRALERLRKQFPQVTLCTCVARVPEEVSITEFGFWLFNQSVPNGPRLTERRLHSILFCIDPERKEASLTVGYGLDPFIDDESLQRCLAKVRPHLERERYGVAIAKLCPALLPVLRRGFDQAKQAYTEYRAARSHQRHRDVDYHRPLPPKVPETKAAQPHDTHV